MISAETKPAGASFLGFGPGNIKLDVELASPTHRRAQDFLTYCEEKRGDQPILRRHAVRPAEITVLLPDLFIVERIDNDWRYRLAGGTLAARAGVEFTGKALRQICESSTADAARRLYESVARRRQPTVVRSSYQVLGATNVVFEAVQVPLLARDGVTVQVFGGMFFFH